MIYWPRCEKTCLRMFANNKDTDQPAHPHRLVSAFIKMYSLTEKNHVLTCFERNFEILVSLCS